MLFALGGVVALASAGPESHSTPANTTTWLQFAGICGIASVMLFTLDWIVAGIFEDNYSNMRQDVSDFGALTATHPIPYNIVLSITGLLAVVAAIGMFAVFRHSIWGLLGSLAMFVFGFGQFLDGLLREDCSPSGNVACREALDAGELSWHHQAHDIESLFTIGAIILAPLLLAFAFRQRDRWRDLFPWSLVAFAVTLAAIVAYAIAYSGDGSDYSGLLQRAAILAGTGWFAVVSWRLFRVADNP